MSDNLRVTDTESLTRYVIGGLAVFGCWLFTSYDIINWCVFYTSTFLLALRPWAGENRCCRGAQLLAIVRIVSKYVIYFTEETSFCLQHRIAVSIQIRVIGSYSDNTREVLKSTVQKVKRLLPWANTSSTEAFLRYMLFRWNSKFIRRKVTGKIHRGIIKLYVLYR